MIKQALLSYIFLALFRDKLEVGKSKPRASSWGGSGSTSWGNLLKNLSLSLRKLVQ